MFSRRTFNLLWVFVLVGILMSQPISTSSQVEEIFTPSYKTTTAQFTADENNDLFVQSNPSQDFLNDKLFSNGSVDGYQHSEKVRSSVPGDPRTDGIQVSGPSIWSFDNNTNARTRVDFSSSYFSLLEGRARNLEDDVEVIQEEPRNIFMQDDGLYGFIINVSEIGPSFISIRNDAVESVTTYTMDVDFISPSGDMSSSAITMTQHTEDLIPFIPGETGQYIVFLSPRENVIVDRVSLIEDPTIVQASSGYSERITGENTVGKFLRIKGKGAQQIVDIEKVITNSQYLDFLNYLGTITMRYFVMDNLQTAGTGLGSPYIATDDDIYVSLVATPPDESDPSIDAAKADAGLPSGMDLTYSMVVRNFPITELVTNRNIWTRTNAYSDNFQLFHYEAEMDQLIGLNSTSEWFEDTVSFMPTDTNQSTVTLDPSDNDVMNIAGHDFKVLPAGDYIVQLVTNDAYYFQTFMSPALDMNDTTTVDLGLGDVVYLELSDAGFVYNWLNITMQNDLNISAEFTLRYYDSEGIFQGSNTTITLDTYFDNVLTNVSKQLTQASHKKQYVSISVDNIEVLLPDGSVNGTVEADELPVLDILVERFDDFEIANNLSDTDFYLTGELSGTQSASIHSNYSTYEAKLQVDTTANTAYRLVIDSVNRSIAMSLFETLENNWINGQGTYKNISGVDHYILDVTFASPVDLSFGLSIILQDISVNGTLTITLEEVPINVLPELSLGEINLRGETEEETPTIFESPFFYFGLAGLVVAAVFFLRRRGMINI